jgi:signal peptidase I
MHALAGYAKAFLLLALVIGGAYLQQSYTIRTLADDATLMEPAVHHRGVKLFRTDAEPPARGTIVWFEVPSLPGRMLVSRVVATEGDRVALDDGRLVLDGAPIAEDYALHRVAREDLPEIVVPAGCVYVLNDERDSVPSAFRDSRRLGPIPVAAVVGKISDPVVEKRLAAPRRGSRLDR